MEPRLTFRLGDDGNIEVEALYTGREPRRYPVVTLGPSTRAYGLTYQDFIAVGRGWLVRERDAYALVPYAFTDPA